VSYSKNGQLGRIFYQMVDGSGRSFPKHMGGINLKIYKKNAENKINGILSVWLSKKHIFHE
jgi:hypothetical protein